MIRLVKRWKYTLAACFLIVIPSVIMLFFPPTRKLGTFALVTFFAAFAREGVKHIR